MMDSLFFELIQVALGNKVCLSHTLSPKEWAALYDITKKQSLVGVCFAGVQRLCNSETSDYCGMSEMQYLTWMGMAAKIQQKNQVVDEQCIAIQKRFTEIGFTSCILKGQGIANLYGENLRGLRQSGDIDVWVQDKSIIDIVEYVKQSNVSYRATAAHVECDLFETTDVELHSEPAFLRCFWHNRKLTKWIHENKSSFYRNDMGLLVPTNEFNLVYMMVHMSHHVLFEGLGLRQLMDYYFVLRSTFNNDTFHHNNVISTLKSLGMLKFAKGIMWIMKEVFALEEKYLICEASEKYGRLILKDVMVGGNFGHHDEKNKGQHGDSAVGRSLSGLKRNMKFIALGPWEILCSPIWSTWHWFWRKRRGLL